MTTIAVILLIIFGILLLLLEFFVVPGVTIAGIGGIILMTGGIFLSYHTFGTRIGTLTLLYTVILLTVVLVLAFKSGTWKKIMLESKIDSHISETKSGIIAKVGDTGKTVSRLAPIGRVLINDEFYEAKSLNLFVDQDVDVEVIKIENKKLIVKPLKKET